MTLQSFRNLPMQRPFKPFPLVMSSGCTYEVRQQEIAWLTRTDLLVGVGETDEGVPAVFRICSPPYAAAIEPIDVAKAAENA